MQRRALQQVIGEEHYTTFQGRQRHPSARKLCHGPLCQGVEPRGTSVPGTSMGAYEIILYCPM